MKKFHLSFIVLFVLVGLSSCKSTGKAMYPDSEVAACVRYKTGKVCFFNRTFRKVSIEIDKQVIHIAAMGKVCLDMEAKSKPYEYSAKQMEGRRKTKWKGNQISVQICETKEVELYANN